MCVCVCMSCRHSNNMRKCLKQGVPHTMALPFTLKKYRKAKRIMKIQIFHHAKNLILKKNSTKDPKSSKK